MSDSLDFLDQGFRTYLERVLDLASAQAGQAEVFGVESLHTPVSFEANRLKFIETKEARGVALRVIVDGRVGLVSTSRLDAPCRLVDEAVAVAGLGASVEYELPGGSDQPRLALYHQDAADWEPAAMVQAGREMIEGLREENSELLCDAHLGKTVQGVAILNSKGLAAGYRKTAVTASVGANWIRGTDVLNVWEGEASPRLGLGFERLVEQVAEKVRLAERAARAPVGQMPVIFTLWDAPGLPGRGLQREVGTGGVVAAIRATGGAGFRWADCHPG